MTRERRRRGDYDYIIRVIQYLDRRHGIHFFISSRDFDILYHWWEKRIPDAVIRDSLDRVVERNRRRQKPLAHFSAFSYEVRKNHQSFLALDVGRQRPEPADDTPGSAEFLAQLPPALEFAAGTISASVFQRLRQGEAAAAGPLQEKLLARFQDDGELNAKTAWFLKNLAPPLRRPEIERKYRLNYLCGQVRHPAPGVNRPVRGLRHPRRQGQKVFFDFPEIPIAVLAVLAQAFCTMARRAAGTRRLNRTSRCRTL